MVGERQVACTIEVLQGDLMKEESQSLIFTGGALLMDILVTIIPKRPS
jgi:hypothetical protein